MNDKIYSFGNEEKDETGNETVIQQKKFLDAEGVKYLWSKINMQDYPNNQTLMQVIEAIDETKADINLQNIELTDEEINELKFKLKIPESLNYIYLGDTTSGYGYMCNMLSGIENYITIPPSYEQNHPNALSEMLAGMSAAIMQTSNKLYKNILPRITLNYPKLREAGMSNFIQFYFYTYNKNKKQCGSVEAVGLYYNTKNDIYTLSRISKINSLVSYEFLEFDGNNNVLYDATERFDDTFTNDYVPASSGAIGRALNEKADKSELFSGSWNDLEDKPFGYKDEYVTIIEEKTYENGSSVSIRYLQSPGTYNIIIDKENIYTITKPGGPSNLGDSTYQNYPFFMEFRGSYYITFEDGQSHLVEFKQLRDSVAFPIDEIFIPDTIARLDYVDNQINTHTHDFDTLTNKPFYENVTITQLDAMKNQAPGPAAVSLPINLTKGEYLVKFNEVEYSIFVDENTTKIESTNLPFIINRSGNEYIGFTWIIQSVDKSTPFTYEISSVERDLKQLDKKFIPNEITDKLNNCLTSKDILIVDLDTEYIFSSDWKNRVKEAHANGQYILIKYNNIYYNITVTEDDYCVGYAFISQSRISGFWHDLNQTEGMSFASGAIDLEEVRNKISNWSNEQSGSTKNYPSINAMEEYVNNQINSTIPDVPVKSVNGMTGDVIIDIPIIQIITWEADD